MNEPQWRAILPRRSSNGFTLMEVVVGMILMATLVVGALTALSRYRRSLGDEARKRQAIAVADQLLDRWVQTGLPGAAQGMAPVDSSIRWQTRVLSQRRICGVQSEIVRLEVWDAKVPQGQAAPKVLTVVEYVRRADSSTRRN